MNEEAIRRKYEQYLMEECDKIHRLTGRNKEQIKIELLQRRVKHRTPAPPRRGFNSFI